jgi:hypothetical protein
MGWMAALAAVPGIASALGGLFGKKDEEGAQINLEQLMPAFQRETGQKLADWIKTYMDQYKPGEAYTGKLSAGATSQEQTGLSILDQFLGGSNLGDLFKAGKGQILDTLSGKYADVNKSPFVNAMREVSNQDLMDALNTSRAGAGARSKFFSTAAMGNEKDLTNRNLQNMNQIIGNFLQTERQNMLGAASTAQGMDQYENLTMPLSKIQASQTFGSLNRTLEQADLERQYNEFTRQRTEMAQPIQAAQSMYGTQSQYGIPSWQMPNTQTNNTFGSIMNLLGGMNFSGLGGSGDLMSKLAGLFSKQ